MTNTILWKDSYAELDVPTLKRTVRYELAKGGLRKAAPIEHFQLLENIVEMTQIATKREVQLDPIICTEAQALRMMWAGKREECPAENYLIQRLLTRIQIQDENEDLNMSIAVAYNESGIQVAFGTNVRICTNLNIFGGTLWSTYGSRNKVPFDKGMEVLKSWLASFNLIRNTNIDTIEKLQKTIIMPNEIEQFEGKLLQNAVLSNNGKAVDAPLNVTEVCRMVEEIDKERSKKQDSGNDFTAWDLTNTGTAVLKPKTSNMIDLLDSTERFNSTILQYFNLN